MSMSKSPQFDNYAVYGLGTYWALFVLLPRIYGEFLLSQANNGHFFLTRPRTLELEAEIRTKVPAETWTWYKKLEGLKDVCLAEFPLYVAAVVLGSCAFKDKGNFNTLSGVYFALRSLHACLYLLGRGSRALWARVWVGLAANGVLLGLLLEAARRMQDKVVLFI
ncbi:uncharacterized protein EI97DRAFT_466689 [Westerdykella ornata]|uniref:Uncharacterized protein n=1 Tax=Westerdykella ornata TaxID=318751 RepID=A0A6A6JM24_WESOR|nr:uncharacterized protein EI97DRAFT_466689 [Westerdykella ornata]KAF2277163.1 hypothetical protein EI97DRAFT_466689 [Westerdykella ornata]